MEKRSGGWGWICIIVVAIALFTVAFTSLYMPGDNNFLSKETVKEYPTIWTIMVDGNEAQYKELPSKVDALPNHAVTLKTILPENSRENQVIMFRSTQALVKVTVDGNVLHTYGYGENGLPNTSPTGSSWQIFRVPKDYDGKTIEIELISQYKRYTGIINPIYIGTKAAAVFYIGARGFFRLMLAIMMMVTGMAWVIASLFIKKSIISTRWNCQGLCILFFSVWAICETKMLQMFTGQSNTVSAVSFISLMLIPITFLCFIKCLDHFRYDKIVNLMIAAFSIGMVVIIAFQITGIADYIQTMFFIHCALLMLALYVFGNFLVGMVKGKLDNDSKTVLLAIIYAMLFGMLDMAMMYVIPTHPLGRLSSLGMLAFTIIISLWSIRLMATSYTEKIETRTLRKMAYTDILTGLPNRNAYERQLAGYATGEDREIIICNIDMNNLKQINDCYGHMVGDDAIRLTANSIWDCVKERGYGFRVGGDEFILIFEDVQIDIATSYIKEVQEEISNNSRGQELNLTIAYGLISCRTGDTAELEKAIKMSDILMYQRKAEMKSHMADSGTTQYLQDMEEQSPSILSKIEYEE